MSVTIRPATPADADAAAQVIYDAFVKIAADHNFPVDFPGVELAQRITRGCIADARCYSVVAEMDGNLVGSNFLDERDAVRGVGPITVDPNCQAQGVGRKLMQAVLDRAKGAPSIRLVQEAFNRTSMALYTSLGFDIREPLAIISGELTENPSPGADVQPMREHDLPQCTALSQRLLGFDRTNELRDDIARHKPFVLRRSGQLRAYCGAAEFYLLNHGVAETDQDMFDLLLGAGNALKIPIGLLLPTRQSNFFRWCLARKMRIVKPMSLMSMGEYQRPRGCWFPSISY